MSQSDISVGFTNLHFAVVNLHRKSFIYTHDTNTGVVSYCSKTKYVSATPMTSFSWTQIKTPNGLYLQILRLATLQFSFKRTHIQFDGLGRLNLFFQETYLWIQRDQTDFKGLK